MSHTNQPLPQASVNVATRQPQQNFFRGRGGYRGKGRGFRNNSQHVIFFGRGQSTRDTIFCQLCGKPGHTAKKCFHRFDITYAANSDQCSPLAFVASSSSPTDSHWHPDTGATHHLTNDITNLNLRSEDYDGADQIHVGNGAGLQISKIGSSTLSTSTTPFILNQVLLVLEIQKNLVSVQEFCKDNNVYFEFHHDFFVVKDYLGNLLHQGAFKDGLYSFSRSVASLHPHCFSAIRAPYQLWHQRLSHASPSVAHKAVSAFTFPAANKRHPVCSDCQHAKSCSLPFSSRLHTSKFPLDLVYSDVWGPASTLSNSGCRYYVSFLDDCTKFLWLFPLKLKSDVASLFLQFQSYVERLFEQKIKMFQSD